MTLTFELVRDIIQGNVPAKFQVRSSNGSTMRALTDRQTDRHTDTQTHTQTGPILYPRPLTREGNICHFHTEPIVGKDCMVSVDHQA